MWYFSWVLGVGFAVAFSILNAMWLELHVTKPIETRQ
jgi:cytochrome bd-I ubiquinol oxidase subunit X